MTPRPPLSTAIFAATTGVSPSCRSQDSLSQGPAPGASAKDRAQRIVPQSTCGCTPDSRATAPNPPRSPTTRPRPHRPFSRRPIHRLHRGITQRQKHLLRPRRIPSPKLLQRLPKCVQPKIPVPRTPIHTVEKGRDVDQPAAGLHEIEVEDLLPRHGCAHGPRLTRPPCTVHAGSRPSAISGPPPHEGFALSRRNQDCASSADSTSRTQTRTLLPP